MAPPLVFASVEMNLEFNTVVFLPLSPVPVPIHIAPPVSLMDFEDSTLIPSIKVSLPST